MSEVNYILATSSHSYKEYVTSSSIATHYQYSLSYIAPARYKLDTE